MNARKLKKKKLFVFLKTFEFRRKKQMTLKLFEFLGKFVMDTFLLKIIQFEKFGSTIKKINFSTSVLASK